MIHGLGDIPDLPDYRDEDFVALARTLPSLPNVHTDMGQWYRRLNQKLTQSCTGFAAKQAICVSQLANQGEVIIDPSALGSYFNGCVFHEGLKDVDIGSYLRSVFRGLNAYGIIAEADWPFDAAKVTVRPSVGAELHAYKHRKARYRRIFATGDRRLDQLRGSVVSLRPLAVGIPVYESFMADVGPTHIEAPDPATDKAVGWHAICILGYKIEAGRLWFLIGNSWDQWRDGGRAWLSSEYLLLAADLWSIELVDVPEAA